MTFINREHAFDICLIAMRTNVLRSDDERAEIFGQAIEAATWLGFLTVEDVVDAYNAGQAAEMNHARSFSPISVVAN